METTLAAREDAATILKLYELRQEVEMRKARHWLTAEFWPSSAGEVRQILAHFGEEKNRWFRQVVTYWEMAAALVNHGVLAPELFVEVSSEPFFIAAKLWPYLSEIRQDMPACLVQMERLVERSAAAKQRLEAMEEATRGRREQARARMAAGG